MSLTMFTSEEIDAMLAADEADRARLQADEIEWRRKTDYRMGTITGPLFGPDQEDLF